MAFLVSPMTLINQMNCWGRKGLRLQPFSEMLLHFARKQALNCDFRESDSVQSSVMTVSTQIPAVRRNRMDGMPPQHFAPSDWLKSMLDTIECVCSRSPSQGAYFTPCLPQKASTKPLPPLPLHYLPLMRVSRRSRSADASLWTSVSTCAIIRGAR